MGVLLRARPARGTATRHAGKSLRVYHRGRQRDSRSSSVAALLASSSRRKRRQRGEGMRLRSAGAAGRRHRGRRCASGCGHSSWRGTSGSARINSSSTSSRRSSAARQRQHVLFAFFVELPAARSSPCTKRSAGPDIQRHRHRLQAALARQRQRGLRLQLQADLGFAAGDGASLTLRRPGHRLRRAVLGQGQRVLQQPAHLGQWPLALRAGPRPARRPAHPAASGRQAGGRHRAQSQAWHACHRSSVAAGHCRNAGGTIRGMSPDPPLILASTSRYRHELLSRLRLPFEVCAPEVDETPLAGETPAALAQRLALAKARAVAALQPDAVVIGSDQVADLDGAGARQARHARARRRSSCADARPAGAVPHRRGGGPRRTPASSAPCWPA